MADHAAHGLVPVLTSLEEVKPQRAWLQLHHTPHRVAHPPRYRLDPPGSARARRGRAAEPSRLAGGLAHHRLGHAAQPLRCAARPGLSAPTRAIRAMDRPAARSPPLCRYLGRGGWPSLHGDHARVGAALYGIDTSPDHGQQLAVVATLTAPVLQVVAVPADTAVGYGGLFPHATALAHCHGGGGVRRRSADAVGPRPGRWCCTGTQRPWSAQWPWGC